MMLKIKEILSIENFFSFSTYLFVFTIALMPFISSLSLGFLLLSSIALLIKKKSLEINKNILSVLFFSTLLLLDLFGLIYSPNITSAIQIVFRLVPIALIPLLFCFSKLYNRIKTLQIKRVYILGITLSCIISLVISVVKVFLSGKTNYLFYYDLSSILHLHPTYYSLFVLTAILFLYEEPFFKKSQKNTKTFLITFFIVFLFLLQTKLAILILLVLMLLNIFINREKRALNTFILIGLLGTIFILSYQMSSGIRINELLKKRNGIDIGNFDEDGVSQRAWLWKEAIHQFKEKPVFGYGLESQKTIFRWNVEKEILSTPFLHYSYIRASKELVKKNLHNQYLQILYELGIVGLVMFLLSILVLLIRGVKYKNIIFLLVYSVFLAFMTTENLLYRQMGIYFYSFMLPYLYLTRKNATIAEEQ